MRLLAGLCLFMLLQQIAANFATGNSAHLLPNSVACAGTRDGQFVRNSASCAAYFYCHDGGRADPDSCPAPYLFNARRQICDHPHLVDCTRCSPHGVQNLPDPHDHRRYFHCVAGVRLHRWCSEGLWFDAAEGECNLQHVLEAVAAQTNDYEDDDESEAATNAGQLIDNRVCSNFAHLDFVQFGDPEDCSRYYVCIRGVGYRETCAANLLFNAIRGYCDRAGRINFCQTYGPVILPKIDSFDVPAAELVNHQPNVPQSNPPSAQQPSANQPLQKPPPPTQQQPAAPPPNATWSGEYLCTRPNGNFSVPDSCSTYVLCANGVQLNPVRTCPAGTHFHRLYGECSAFGQEHCYRSDFENAWCKADNGNFGVPGWCARYVQCAGRKIIERFSCEFGHYWSVSAGRCTTAKPTYC